MNSRSTHPHPPAVVCLAMLLAWVFPAGAAHSAPADALESAIEQAERDVGESGSAAATARAEALVRAVCASLAPEMKDPADAQRFMDIYDQLRQERGQWAAYARQTLRDASPDVQGRARLEDGIRRALLLEDARAGVLACVKRGGDSSAPADAPDPARSETTGNTAAFCEDYATSAQSQQQSNIASGCGFIGGRWQANYDSHYTWCLGAPERLVASETRIRTKHLKQCRDTANRNAAPVCDGYARQAQSQQAEHLKLGCGFEGGRWQPSYENHYNWCMRVTAAAVNKETAARARQLEACRK